MYSFTLKLRAAAFAALAVIITVEPRSILGEEAGAAASKAEPLSLVVMDPLAAPLSCPCVAGYAQRKYEVLAEEFEKTLGRPVVLTFSESLTKALQKEGCTTAHVIIGKDAEASFREQGLL